MLGVMELTQLTIVVIAANILGAAMAVPQARKLLQTRRADGVSITWALASASVNAWWGLYGVGIADLSIVPVSVISVASYLTITVTVLRFSARPARQLLRPAGVIVGMVTTIPAFALALGGWLTAGIVLGALYGVQLFPAVVAVYRATDVSGVSLATWVIAFAEAALWGVYGFGHLDAGLLTLAGTGLSMSSLVLARLFVRRPRRGWVERPVDLAEFATV